MPAYSFIAAFLIDTKYLPTTRKNPFRSYINCLPTDLSNFAVELDRKQLKYLTGSPILEQIVAKKKMIQHDYQLIMDSVDWQGIHWYYFTLEEFTQMNLIASSRAFTMYKKDMQSGFALVPYADFCNHRDPPNARWDCTEDVFEMKAMEDIKQGEQIFTYYGDLCNMVKFINYGFV